MPLYTLTTQNGALSSDAKAKLAFDLYRQGRIQSAPAPYNGIKSLPMLT